jgi:hypothetical protein
MYPVSGVTQMDKLQQGTQEYTDEIDRYQKLLDLWRTDQRNRELIEQMGVSLKKLGLNPEHSDRRSLPEQH